MLHNYLFLQDIYIYIHIYIYIYIYYIRLIYYIIYKSYDVIYKSYIINKAYVIKYCGKYDACKDYLISDNTFTCKIINTNIISIMILIVIV